jgi:hypothetical protein
MNFAGVISTLRDLSGNFAHKAGFQQLTIRTWAWRRDAEWIGTVPTRSITKFTRWLELETPLGN